MFKATIPYEPYFYVACRVSRVGGVLAHAQGGTEGIVEEWLVKAFEGLIVRVQREKKWDLNLVSLIHRTHAETKPNHLLSAAPVFLKLFFHNTQDFQQVRRELLPLATANSAKFTAVDAYADVVGAEQAANGGVGYGEEEGGGRAWGEDEDAKKRKDKEPADCIIEVREHDIAYYLRVAIDLNLRVGLWYQVSSSMGLITMERLTDRVKRAEPVVMAYDIETSKQPLKFPDQQTDQIMMISYMIDGQGYLITNREIVGDDIDDFEYTPKPEYEGEFTIFNEPDEVS